MKKSSFKRSLALFMAILMLVTSVPILAFATNESGVKPADNTTLGQPFVENNPSDIYRIPCMVTLDDGTIVTAADARWNGGMDGGGNDTIVSRSTDNGIHWDYTMVNYYPDNGNVFNKASCGVCDSELVTDGKNVWLLSVFFPAGYALNAKSANNQVKSGDTAFTEINGVQRVKLFKNGESGSYNYYVGDFDAAGAAGRAPIMSNDGTKTGYYVDHDYYIYNGTTKTGSNLFYSDGQYQTAKVNFLLLRKSTDGGKTWGDFTPVNMKNSDEAFFGVGPGRGVYDKDHGRIIFSTYSWNGTDNSQRSSFIYSDDEGQTWTRSDNFPNLKGVFSGNWSSESQIVQLDKDHLFCFVRNGWKRLHGALATYNESTGKYTWGDFRELYVQTNGTPATGDIGNQSGCQLSAIKYSEKLQYNGNYYTAVFVSTPKYERAGGVVYTLLFDDNYNIVNLDSEKKENDKQISYEISSPGVSFGYSCMTELKDGRIGLLYEINGANDITYTTFDPLTASGCRLPDTVGKTYTVDLAKGDAKSFYVDTNQVTKFDTDNPDNTDPKYIRTAFSAREGSYIHLADDATFSGVKIQGKNALYTFQKNQNDWTVFSQGVYLTIKDVGIPSTARKAGITIKQDAENKDKFLFIDSGDEALCYHRDDNKSRKFQFDRSTAYGTINGAKDGDADRSLAQFEVFRPLKSGETASQRLIPGYEKITSLDQIVNGGEYLIACQVDGNYYVLYPSTSTTNPYSHSAKVGAVDTSGFFMDVNALLKGSTTIVAGKDTYIINVSDFSNEILGVVEYDPVIYTHGSPDSEMGHTELGSFIADATWEGEKSTHFKIRDAAKGKYKIVSVSAMSAPNSDGEVESIEGAEITFDYDSSKNDGMLHGVLPLCNENTSSKDYKHYDVGEYVTLKTIVEDSDGKLYTQTDRLYVASNPVAGHVALGVTVSRSAVNSVAYMLANNSYGNTINPASDFGVGYKHNVKRMYSKYFNGGNTNNTSEPLRNGDNNTWSYNGMAQAKNDSIKTAGVLDWSDGATHKRTERCVNYGTETKNSDPPANAIPIAYYYYDVSSNKNEGIVNPNKTVNSDNSVNSTFSIQLSRMAADAYGNQNSSFGGKVIIDYGDAKGKNRWGTWGAGDYLYNKNSRVTQLSASNGAMLTAIDGPFGVSKSGSETSYTYRDFAAQQKTINVNCRVSSMAANSTGSLKGILVYGESWNAGTNTPTLNMNLPFEILICNKQEQRAAYEESVKQVLKSTDYTTSTWKKYEDSVMTYQEYLNNYTLRTPDQKTDQTGKSFIDKMAELDTPANNYNVITKSAQFGVLKEQLNNDKEIRNNGIAFSDGSNYTPDSYLAFVTSYDNGEKFYDDAGKNTDIIFKSPMGEGYDENNPDDVKEVLEIFGGDGIRSETPGWEVGPYNENKLPIQESIESNTEAIQANRPKLAGDDSAYLAAKNEANAIDRTAYVDVEGFDTIDKSFENSDKDLYKEFEYNGVNYGSFLNKDDSSDALNGQPAIDAATAAALTEMTVAMQKTNTADNLKKYKVTVNINGEQKSQEMFYYGNIKWIDMVSYGVNITEDTIIKCVVNTDDASANKVPTTYNTSDFEAVGYNLPVIVQEDITISISTFEKSADNQVVVTDYYGTVLAVANASTVKVDSANRCIVFDGTETVYVKDSPRYNFTSWSLADGEYTVDSAMAISQIGELNKSVKSVIEVIDGTVNQNSTFATELYDRKLLLESPSAVYWTRSVNGSPEELCSYENSFVNFSAGEESIVYRAYSSIDDLPDGARRIAQNGTPVVYGAGYFANNKFTLSINYSAPAASSDDETSGIKVVDAGVIYSTQDLGADGLIKGGANTRTVAANRISHWTSNRNSGTFTMNKGGVETGTHYMRAYVSYTAPYTDPKTGEVYILPYVAYSNTIYKCENGVVSLY